jgi:transposase
VIISLPTCPIPEVARLGRTPCAWRPQLLAYVSTGGVSDRGTEAINLITRRPDGFAHGFRSFTHYRLRILLAANRTQTYRRGSVQA